LATAGEMPADGSRQQSLEWEPVPGAGARQPHRRRTEAYFGASTMII
jgi:hypothetical protein